MSYHRPLPMVPLYVLAKTYMFEPGHPRIPERAAFVRQLDRTNDTLTLEYFDIDKKSLGTHTAKWAQTAPVAPAMRYQPLWTKTGQWGPLITPESR